MSDRATARKTAAWRKGIAALRDRAAGSDTKAKLADKVGGHKVAAKLRHSAKLDRMLADQQEAGLKSGAYLLGKSQHPSVEEQCGCREYCR